MNWMQHVAKVKRPNSLHRLVKLIERLCAQGFFVSDSEGDMQDGCGLMQDKEGAIVFVDRFTDPEPWDNYIVDDYSSDSIYFIYISNCPPLLQQLHPGLISNMDTEYVEIEAPKE